MFAKYKEPVSFRKFYLIKGNSGFLLLNMHNLPLHVICKLVKM